MNISSNLKNFLVKNKIYKIEDIKNKTFTFISSLPGYSPSLKDELSTILNTEIKSVPVNNNIYDISNSNRIILSNRLKNIIKKSEYNLKEFLELSDNDLFKFRSFGSKCMDEVNVLRQLFLKKNQIVFSSEHTSDYSLNKLYIPPEIRDLEFKVIFNLLGHDLSYSKIKPNKLKRRFIYFGDLTGKTMDDLIAIKGVGNKTLKFIYTWFNNLHNSTYADISSNLNGFTIVNLKSSFILTQFLFRLNIYHLKDFSQLDEFIKSDLSLNDKLALLELRTIHIKNEIAYTKTNNNYNSEIDIARDIDLFLNHSLLPKAWKEILLFRWDESGKKTTLEEIGQKKNLTRERIRQIINDAFELFELLFIPNKEIYIEFFTSLINQNTAPLSFMEIANPINEYLHKPEFYLSLLSDFFEYVPFENFLQSTSKKAFKSIHDNLYLFADSPFRFNATKYFSKLNKIEMLKNCNVVFASEKLQFNSKKDNLYINRRFYGILVLLRYFMSESDRILTINDFVTFLKSCPFYKNKDSVDRLVKADPGRSILFSSHVSRIEEFIRFDRYAWGLEKHFNYHNERRNQLLGSCKQVLKSLGHQADVGFIYKKIKKSFPKLVSKYELAELLKQSQEFIDLGFLNFALSESGQQERNTVEKVVKEIFEKDWKPKHASVLIKEIKKHRSFREEAISILHKQLPFIKLYKPAYYGLRTNHDKNTEYLSNNTKYIESYISYRPNDSSLLSEIIDEIEFSEDEKKFLLVLNKTPNLTILSDFKIQDSIIIHKEWSKSRIMICLLASINDSLFFEELKLIIKNELYIPFNETSSYVRYKIENDPRVETQKNGSYKYYDFIEAREKFENLLTDIESYFITNPKIININELYNIISSLSYDNKPKDANELLSLLKIDNRFSVMKGNLVGIL